MATAATWPHRSAASPWVASLLRRAAVAVAGADNNDALDHAPRSPLPGARGTRGLTDERTDSLPATTRRRRWPDCAAGPRLLGPPRVVAQVLALRQDRPAALHRGAGRGGRGHRL